MPCYLSSSFIFIVFSLFTTVSADSDEGKDEREECNGYRDMERIKSCGSDGYAVRYGLANCERFSRAVEQGTFDAVGREWVKCTTECLIDKLFKIEAVPFLRSNLRKGVGCEIKSVKDSPSLSCSSLEDQAFGSHVPCYLECNFCEICRSQKWGLMSTYRIRDFLNLNSISQVYDIISECGLFHCFM
ncbi:hypothetical protein PFISCL1PPCAC_25376 [Pristionchus fissidentatus]|uniref:Uncharacterized protein n=1 Tax=Pristionchus fissidentatus TaxID=1538716 RepID=A0AAV5WTS0_9BILA|nr:hypothetical protein PFISCL1PPCAC_25376 [Pristionchus fissidentatus]